jgi:hypothetical protein
MQKARYNAKKKARKADSKANKTTLALVPEDRLGLSDVSLVTSLAENFTSAAVPPISIMPQPHPTAPLVEAQATTKVVAGLQPATGDPEVTPLTNTPAPAVAIPILNSMSVPYITTSQSSQATSRPPKAPWRGQQQGRREQTSARGTWQPRGRHHCPSRGRGKWQPTRHGARPYQRRAVPAGGHPRQFWAPHSEWPYCYVESHVGSEACPCCQIIRDTQDPIV